MQISLSYLFDGFKLLFKPGIKRFVIIPLIINTILFIGLFFVAKHFFGELNVWVENHVPTWLHWLGSILWLIFFIGFFLVITYTFVTFANLISAPFNSLLSEKVELYLTGNQIAARSWTDIFKDVPRIIERQLLIIGYYITGAIFILILFFIPIIQMLAAACWFLFNAWFMTLQYIDYPTDNHQIPLKDVIGWLKKRHLLSLGFGTCVLIASMIPIVNFFVVPAAVAGATKFWLENSK